MLLALGRARDCSGNPFGFSQKIGAESPVLRRSRKRRPNSSLLYSCLDILAQLEDNYYEVAGTRGETFRAWPRLRDNKKQVEYHEVKNKDTYC
jgi:hypothetical protein